MGFYKHDFKKYCDPRPAEVKTGLRVDELST